MKINGKELKNNLIFAPLAGVSDVGMRLLCSEFGADATFTEMLSARAMHHNPKKTKLLTLTTDAEKIKVAQIFGKEPELMGRISACEVLKKFDAIDINMGCPAPKIVKNGEGSSLMKDPLLASKIISECVKQSNKPVSVKMRLGFDKICACEFAKMCEESGASFGEFWKSILEQSRFINYEVKKINFQYRNNKRYRNMFTYRNYNRYRRIPISKCKSRNI